MNCKQTEDLLADRLAGSISELDAQGLAEHLSKCPACAEMEAQVSLAAVALDDWNLEPASETLVQRTMERLGEERQRSLSLWERARLCIDWFSNLQTTPARAAALAACGFVLYLGLMNIEHRGAVPAAPAGGCRANLKLLDQALERYQASHEGKLPQRLEELIPDQILSLPYCPRAGDDTYSAGFDPEASPVVLRCSGHHHAGEGLVKNQPSLKLER